jgi:hypothetical protein
MTATTAAAVCMPLDPAHWRAVRLAESPLKSLTVSAIEITHSWSLRAYWQVVRHRNEKVDWLLNSRCAEYAID